MKLTLSIAFIAAALMGCGKSEQISIAQPPTQAEPKNASANEAALPTFADGELYSAIRQKMLSAGWKPHTSTESICKNEEDAKKISECKETPELQSCAGNNLNQCEFTWSDGQRIATIETFGEKPVFGTVTFGQTDLRQAQNSMPATNQNGVSDKEKMANSTPAASTNVDSNEERIKKIFFRSDGAWVTKENHALSNKCSEILRQMVDVQNDVAWFVKFSESEYEFKMFWGEKMKQTGMRDEVQRKPIKTFIDGNNMRVDMYQKDGMVKKYFYKVLDNSIELFKLDCDNCDKAKFEDTLQFQQVKTRPQISEFCVGTY